MVCVNTIKVTNSGEARRWFGCKQVRNIGLDLSRRAMEEDEGPPL